MAKKAKSKSLVSVVVFIAFLTWLYLNDSGPDDTKVAGGKTDVSELKVTGTYEMLDGCTFSENRRNDADSFFVNHPEGKTEFRLYYVDAPESRYREYANGDTNGKRISAQGKYFGGLDREATTELGSKGKRFVADLLASKPFKVVTRWENVYSPERKYAFVIVESDGKQVFLHELLTEKGYARIHTKPATMPNGGGIKQQLKKLKALETTAKNAKLGGWQ
ncbi:MAG: thermonuclease family protein [Rubritalea sp.]|uniref:thermonuclease family protein n=1 Tax=Rubritalea sp. TaxID=2109375 RepID=UPI00324260D4